MADKRTSRVIALVLALCTILLCACESEPVDTSIWAQNELPYNYRLDEYVVLGEYRGVSDVPVELEYDFNSRRNARLAKLYPELVTFTKVDTVERGDKVVLECEVYLDGEPCDFIKAGSYEIFIGALTSLDVLSDPYTESLLVNAIQRSINSECEFTVQSFYSDIRYKGKTLNVKSKLVSVYRPDYSALTDNAALEHGYESIEALYNAAEIDVYTEDARIIEYAKKRILWDRAVADATFFTPLPASELARCEEEYIDYYEEIAEYNKISLDEYLKSVQISSEQMLSDARAYAEEKVKNELLAFAIAYEEELIPTQTQCQMLGHELAHTLGYSGYDELISYNTEKSVYVYIIWDTAVTFILDNARATSNE